MQRVRGIRTAPGTIPARVGPNASSAAAMMTTVVSRPAPGARHHGMIPLPEDALLPGKVLCGGTGVHHCIGPPPTPSELDGRRARRGSLVQPRYCRRRRRCRSRSEPAGAIGRTPSRVLRRPLGLGAHPPGFPWAMNRKAYARWSPPSKGHRGSRALPFNRLHAAVVRLSLLGSPSGERGSIPPGRIPWAAVRRARLDPMQPVPDLGGGNPPGFSAGNAGKSQKQNSLLSPNFSPVNDFGAFRANSLTPMELP